MKKIISLLLIACLSLGVIGAFSVSAANDEVLMGTPIIDGALDEMYKESLTLEFSGDPETNAFADTADSFTGSAMIYALYDADFVYLCAVVKDDDVVQPDDSHYQKWNANGIDGVEFRLNFADTTDSSKQFKVTADAHGLVTSDPSRDGHGKGCFTIQPTICNMEHVVASSSLTADGYIIEVAVGHSYNDNNQILDAGELGLNVWLLDLQEFAAGSLAPVIHSEYIMYGEDLGNGNGVAVGFPLSSDVVTGGTDNLPPDTTPETEPVTEAPETEPVTDEPETEAPETDPVTDEPETEPVTDAPETDPVTDAPETDPVDNTPDTDPAPADEEGGNMGLIIGIVAAVIVVIAIIAVVLGKKKKA